MQARSQVRRRVRWMPVAYGLAALIAAVSLAAPGGSGPFWRVRSCFWCGLCSSGPGFPHQPVIVGSGGAGTPALPLAMVLVLAPSSLVLVACVVPTWLPPVLAIILVPSV